MNKKLFLFTAFICLLGASCKKFLEEVPYTNKTPSLLLQDNESATAFLTGVYDRLASSDPSFDASYRRGMLIVANFGTDDFTAKVGTNVITSDFNDYTFTANDLKLRQIWNNFYAGINQASDIIVNIPKSPLGDSIKNQYTAEAKFLRGFLYFNLVRMFGGVPLVLAPTASLDNLNTSRSSVQEVYAQVIKDLTDALPSLREARFVPAGRATKGAALALLCKVYLTQASYGKYKPVAGYSWVDIPMSFTQAVSYANQAMALPDYALQADYSAMFTPATENNSEIIFSVQMEGSATISDEGSFLTNLFGPANIGDINLSRGGQNQGRASRNLINKYATGDLRRSWNIASFGYRGCDSVAQATQFYASKWRKPCGFNGQHFSDPNNFPVLRLADVMLMAAEADAELNGGAATPYALNLVNTLRRKRYVASVTPTAPTGNFLDFVFDERSRELCYEGQRWFDLVRTGRLIAAVKATVQSYTGPFLAPGNIQVRHYLYPIPQTEIDNNSKIDLPDQNPGY